MTESQREQDLVRRQRAKHSSISQRGFWMILAVSLAILVAWAIWAQS